MCRLALLPAAVVICLSMTGAGVAQDTDPAAPEASASGKEYHTHCLKNRLDCRLIYNESAEPPKTETRAGTGGGLYVPVISGPVATTVVLALLGVAILLWLRFGNGGVLLSSAPRELKRNSPAPDGWRLHEETVPLSSGDLMDRIAAMADQREAMILLLRHCLLHAADISAIHLARSDTERSALRRMPDTLPGRPLLEELLGETELVHYGGFILEQTKFTALIDTARRFLAQRQVRHA